MAEPFLGEVRMVGFNFAPRGWAFCNGQIIPINQNQSLYSLLSNTYGGDGLTSFALPDLRGRAPSHTGSAATGNVNRDRGKKYGTEKQTLNINQLPRHSHTIKGSISEGNNRNPEGKVFAQGRNVFHSSTNPTSLDPSSFSSTGGSGHNNMQPYLTINFCIALRGLFPSPN